MGQGPLASSLALEGVELCSGLLLMLGEGLGRALASGLCCRAGGQRQVYPVPDRRLASGGAALLLGVSIPL